MWFELSSVFYVPHPLNMFSYVGRRVIAKWFHRLITYGTSILFLLVINLNTYWYNVYKKKGKNYMGIIKATVTVDLWRKRFNQHHVYSLHLFIYVQLYVA